jgi:hypothetical protein
LVQHGNDVRNQFPWGVANVSLIQQRYRNKIIINWTSISSRALGKAAKSPRDPKRQMSRESKSAKQSLESKSAKQNSGRKCMLMSKLFTSPALEIQNYIAFRTDFPDF